MDRRQFLRSAAAAAGLTVLAELGAAGPASAAPSGPYGGLRPADAEGLRLPAGFRSRVIATSGETVPGTNYRWHQNPDGGAVFATSEGGWIYVSNDETGNGRGGVSMLRFDGRGSIIEAGRILDATTRNCAGGATPWGTWLSCEEFAGGRVWECDPSGIEPSVVRPAMGVFHHEAAAADSARAVIYMTEDRPDGGLYRFVPDVWRDLSSGRLQVLAQREQALVWTDVPDPGAGDAPTRTQVDTMIRFDGGEGIWFEGKHLYFTTKGDNRVWRLDVVSSELDVIYDIGRAVDPVLRGVDNITMTPAGDLFVCEDGGNMEIVLLTGYGRVAPFLRLEQTGSELTGVAFDPSGTRMYFSSQRDPGRTYEVSGPFRQTITTARDPSRLRSPGYGSAEPADSHR